MWEIIENKSSEKNTRTNRRVNGKDVIIVNVTLRLYFKKENRKKC